MMLREFGYELKRVHSRVSIGGTSMPNSEAPKNIDTATDLAAGDFTSSENPLTQHFLSHSGSDLNKWHHYFDVYHRWFAPFRGKANLRVLEIGVSKGGSLRMWRDYFGSTATIVGIDINSDCQRHENPNEQIFVRIGSQDNVSFLKDIVEEFGPFDIIIDDGSHFSPHQITTLKALYVDGLKNEGVYLVEDTHANNWEVANDEVSKDSTFIHFAKQLVDRLGEPYDQFIDVRNFKLNHPMRVMRCSVSYFCAHTKGIYFADSVVVFEKSARSMPVHQTR